MNVLTGVAITIVSVLLGYLLHSLLNAELLAVVLFLLSTVFAAIDHTRKYYYVVGLVSFPLFTAASVVYTKDQSLYPVIVFYELAIVAMVLFGSYLGGKTRSWIQSIKINTQNYNYFRTYDPEIGRYIESDPIGLQGGLNTFGYVGGAIQLSLLISLVWRKTVPVRYFV